MVSDDQVAKRTRTDSQLHDEYHIGNTDYVGVKIECSIFIHLHYRYILDLTLENH